jgi:hypothetical protein
MESKQDSKQLDYVALFNRPRTEAGPACTDFFEQGAREWFGTSNCIGHDSRICFGINYYPTLEDAMAAHHVIVERGDTYNGGWFHGMPCGRESNWDRKHPETGEVVAFAVTTR